MNREPLKLLISQPCLLAIKDRDNSKLLASKANSDCMLWTLPQMHASPPPAINAGAFYSATFCDEGRMLATAGAEQHVLLWELPKQSLAGFSVRLDGDRAHRGAFSLDSQYLAVTAGAEVTEIYQTQTGELVSQIDSAQAPGSRSVATFMLPDNQRLVIANQLDSQRGTLELWNWRTATRLSSLEIGALIDKQDLPPLSSNREGDRLIVHELSDALRVFAVKEDEIEIRSELPDKTLYRQLCFDTDGNGVLLTGANAVLRWDFEANRVNGVLLTPTQIIAASIADQGRFLTTVGDDRTIHCWKFPSGELLAGPFVSRNPVNLLESSNDGRHILVGNDNASIRVLNTFSGKWLGSPIYGIQRPLVRFRPNQPDQIVFFGRDDAFDTWNCTTGRRMLPTEILFPLSEDQDTDTRCLELSPDGRFAAAGGNQALRVIDLAPLDIEPEVSVDEMLLRAEIISHHELKDDGTLSRLSFSRWYDRWQQLQQKDLDDPTTNTN